MKKRTYEEYRKFWKELEREPIKTDFPVHLDIELTDACNLKCSFCFQNFMEYKRSLMPYETFTKIIDEGSQNGLCAIKLQSRGESFLHPKIAECIKYAKDNGILDIQVTTNALLLNDEKIDLVVKNGLDVFIISYDLVHAEATRKTPKPMTNQEFTSFIQEVVTKLDKARKKYNSNLKIRIQEAQEDYSAENIAAVERKNKALFPEADYFLVNPIYSSHEDAPHLANLDQYTFHPCSYLWQRLTLYACGSVTTCSRDYNCKFNRLGNVNSSTVKEIWTSPAMKDLRDRHLGGKREEFHICALCENYLIHKETEEAPVGCTGIVYDLKETPTKKLVKLGKYRKK